MAGHIREEEVRTVKSLCEHPELDTAEKIAAGPYAHAQLTAERFADALEGLRDKLLAYEEDGHWALTPDARKNLCSGEEPFEQQGAKAREKAQRQVPARAPERQ